MVGGGDHFYQPAPGWGKMTDFEQIFARSASAVTPSEKVQLTLIGVSYAHSNERKMNIVRRP